MAEKIDYTGKWWFPEHPDQEYIGRLTFSEEQGMRVQLTSFEVFSEYLESKEKLNKKFVILGTATDGTKKTLKDCRLRSDGPNHCGPYGNTVSFQQTEFYVFNVILGAHFENPDSVKFNLVSVKISHVDRWAEKGTPGFFPKKGLPKGFKAKFKEARTYNFDVNDELSLDIIIDTSPTTKPPSEISITQSARVQLKSTTAKSLEFFIEAIRVLNNFFTLAISFPTYPMSIFARTDSAKTIAENKEYYFPIQILPWQPPWQVKLAKREPIDIQSYLMLFTLRDIQRKKTVFSQWFERKEILTPVFDLYFGTLYLDGYISNDFLNLVQALEAYHQRTMKKQDAMPKKFKTKIDSLIDAQNDKEFKEFLAQRLRNNQLSLRRRLNDLIDTAPQAILNYIGDTKNFVSKIVITRNYYTHYNLSVDNTMATLQETVELVEKIRTLLQYSLLTEMGFNRIQAEKLILKKLNWQ